MTQPDYNKVRAALYSALLNQTRLASKYAGVELPKPPEGPHANLEEWHTNIFIKAWSETEVGKNNPASLSSSAEGRALLVAVNAVFDLLVDYTPALKSHNEARRDKRFGKLDPYGHLLHVIGDDDTFVCFDFGADDTHGYILAVINSETGGYIDTFETSDIVTLPNMLGIAQAMIERAKDVLAENDVDMLHDGWGDGIDQFLVDIATHTFNQTVTGKQLRTATRTLKHKCRRCGVVVEKGQIYYRGPSQVPIHLLCPEWAETRIDGGVVEYTGKDLRD